MTEFRVVEPPKLPPGFTIGHWSDTSALTGCTVIICPARTVGGCDVRGSSPGSRELALLASEKTMQEIHAVVLTGGMTLSPRLVRQLKSWIRYLAPRIFVFPGEEEMKALVSAVLRLHEGIEKEKFYD